MTINTLNAGRSNISILRPSGPKREPVPLSSPSCVIGLYERMMSAGEGNVGYRWTDWNGYGAKGFPAILGRHGVLLTDFMSAQPCRAADDVRSVYHSLVVAK